MRRLLVLLVVLSGCVTKPRVDPYRHSGYILPLEADDNDRFCVEVPFQPPYDPSSAGLHCESVGEIRRWMGGQLVTP